MTCNHDHERVSFRASWGSWRPSTLLKSGCLCGHEMGGAWIEGRNEGRVDRRREVSAKVGYFQDNVHVYGAMRRVR